MWPSQCEFIYTFSEHAQKKKKLSYSAVNFGSDNLFIWGLREVVTGNVEDYIT